MSSDSLSAQSARVQIADSHLTYIGIPVWRAGEEARYDVYPADGGHQLGWVFRERRGWTALSDDPTIGIGPLCRTRWEAAIALWGTYPRASDQFHSDPEEDR